MIAVDTHLAARAAVAPHPDRPATAVLLDTPDVRLVVFRLRPGQAVPPHRSPSSVVVTVLSGFGILSGANGERLCGAGEIAAFEPQELHGMRATEGELLLLATITPRPGSRPSTTAPQLAGEAVR
jgi:quercetin dioxygenase-like cupin family protein